MCLEDNCLGNISKCGMSAIYSDCAHRLVNILYLYASPLFFPPTQFPFHHHHLCACKCNRSALTFQMGMQLFSERIFAVIWSPAGEKSHRLYIILQGTTGGHVNKRLRWIFIPTQFKLHETSPHNLIRMNTRVETHVLVQSCATLLKTSVIENEWMNYRYRMYKHMHTIST